MFLIKKPITINSSDKLSAHSRGLNLPSIFYVHICMQCWTVNPKKEKYDESTRGY